MISNCKALRGRHGAWSIWVRALLSEPSDAELGDELLHHRKLIEIIHQLLRRHGQNCKLFRGVVHGDLDRIDLPVGSHENLGLVL